MRVFLLFIAVAGLSGCPQASETDPQVGSVGESGQWCVSDGDGIACDQPAPVLAEEDPTLNTLVAGSWCTTDGSTVSCDAAEPVLVELDPAVGSLVDGGWCTSDGQTVQCDGASPVLAEDDPEVGTLMSSAWCTADAAGTSIVCTASAPVLTEVDPQVGTLSAGGFCTSDGTTVNCTAANPDTRCDNTTCGAVQVDRVDYNSPRSVSFWIDESDFRPRDGGSLVEGHLAFGGTHITNGVGYSMTAGVHVPIGVRVTGVRFAYEDNNASVNLQFDLLSKTETGGYSLHASLTSSGTPGRAAGDSTFSPFTTSPTSIYFVRAITTVDPWPTGGSLKVRGVRITYELDSAF